MSLQELTATLRKKEDEKSEILKDIQKLKDLATSKRALGRLVFQVNECFFDGTRFDLSVHSPDLMVPMESNNLSNKGIKEESEIYLTSKEAGLEIIFLVAGLEYTALLDVQEVPDDDSITMSLEATCTANGAKTDIRIQATFDFLETMLKSKTVEFEQAVSDVAAVKTKVQEAAKGIKANQAKKLGPKPKAPAPARPADESDEDVEEVEDFDEEEEGNDDGSNGVTITQTVINAAGTALAMCLQHKAVGMFLVTSFAIYFHGDQMSV